MIMSDKLLIFLSTFLVRKDSGLYFRSIEPMIDRVAEKTRCNYKEEFFLVHGNLHLRSTFKSKFSTLVRSEQIIEHARWTRLDEQSLLNYILDLFEDRIRQDVIMHLCSHGVAEIDKFNEERKANSKAKAQMLKTKDIVLTRFDEKVDEDFLILRRR